MYAIRSYYALFKIGTIGENTGTSSELLTSDSIDIIDYQNGIDEPVEKLRRHQIDMLIDFNTKEYYLNTESSASELLRILVSDELTGFTEKSIEGTAVRYSYNFV